MRRTGTGRYSPIQPRALLAAAGGGANPYAVLDDPDVIAAYVARWEGDGAAPPQLASRAQNSGIVAGDPLPALTDWSAAGNHLAQATLAQQPTWEVSGTADATPWAYFDGTAWLATPTMDLPASLTALAVLDWQIPGGGTQVLAEAGDASSGVNGLYLALVRGSTATLVRNRRASTNVSGLGNVDLDLSDPLVIQATLGPSVTDLDMLIDGVSEISSTSGTTVSDTALSAPLTVGARSSGTSGVVGYLRGLAILGRSASPETIASVLALLEGTS